MAPPPPPFTRGSWASPVMVACEPPEIRLVSLSGLDLAAKNADHFFAKGETDHFLRHHFCGMKSFLPASLRTPACVLNVSRLEHNIASMAARAQVGDA